MQEAQGLRSEPFRQVLSRKRWVRTTYQLHLCDGNRETKRDAREPRVDRRNREGDELVATLYCSCEQQHQVWGEFWWVRGKHVWMFFDDQGGSETYTERLTHCPACSQRLERKNLTAVA